MNVRWTRVMPAIFLCAISGLGWVLLSRDQTVSNLAQGTVVNTIPCTFKVRSDTFTRTVLVIQFTDKRGLNHVAAISSCPEGANVSNSADLYSKGDQVTILYSPDNPTQIMLREDSDPKFRGDMLLIIAPLLIGLFLVIRFIIVRRVVRPQPATAESIHHPSISHHVRQHRLQRRNRTHL